MALVACRECGREASNQARRCPHCGAISPGFTEGVQRKIALGCLGLFVLIAVLLLFG